jgi:hypothetical protein
MSKLWYWGSGDATFAKTALLFTRGSPPSKSKEGQLDAHASYEGCADSATGPTAPAQTVSERPRVILPEAEEGVQCSLASAAGNFGANLNGTLILPTGPVPAPAVVRATADSAGNLSFTEARSIGGGFANETATGTWAVDPDCTGTATLQVFDSGQLVRTSALALVFNDHSRELRFVQESLMLPNGTNVPVVI